MVCVSRAGSYMTFNIAQPVPDSQTICMKQKVRFQVGICPEKNQLDQIQNGRLSVIIGFNIMSDI